MAEIIQEGVVKVGFDDHEVESGLDRMVAKTKADLAAINREKAVVHVKYNVQDAKLALAAAKEAERELAREIRNREQALKSADATRKGGLTAALNARRAEQQALEGETKIMRQHVKLLEDRLRSGQRVIEQERLGARERSTSDRAQIEAAKEKARYDREHSAALRQDTRFEEQRRTAALRALETDAKKIALQERQLALQKRISELERAAGRAQGSDRMRVGLEGGRAVAEMAKLHEELRLMGAKPIIQKVEVERSALSKLGDLFGIGQRDNIKDLHTRLFDLAKGAKDARVQLGFMSASLQGVVVGGAALAPIITGLVGAVGALAASAGAGLGGALGLGAAGLTGFGMAAIGMVSTLKPFITQLGMAHQYTQRLNAQIAKYGANSKQGQRAQQQFNSQIAHLPPIVQEVVKGYHQLDSEWKKLTQPTANRQIGNIIGATFKTVRADMKFFAKDTNQAFVNVAAGWSGLMKQFRTRDARAGLDTIFQNFNRTIPSIFNAFSRLADAGGRVLVNFSKYLPGIATGFDDWAKRVDNASKRTNGFAGGVDTMVTSFKTLVHFIGAATRFLFEFFRAGVKPGNGLINDMTRSLTKLSDQMSTVSGQRRLTAFFDRSITTTKELWNALLPLVSAFVQFSQVTAPITNIALKLAAAFTKVVAVLVAFKPLQYVAGTLLFASVLGRVGSGMWNLGKAAVSTGGKLFQVMKLISGGGGIRDSFRSVFSGGEGIGASILASSREGSALYAEAITAASSRGAVAIAGAMEAAGATVATEVGAAEVAGGAAGAAGGLGGAAGAAAGGGGLLAALKGIGLKGLLKGAGIAGLGITASQLLGGAIGGKGGGAVKTIGGFAAGGAAIGSVVPGLGTVAGGIAGGLTGGIVEAFKLFNKQHAHDLGKDMADRYTAPLGPALRRVTGQGTDPTLRKLGQQATAADQGKPTNLLTRARGGPQNITVPTSISQPKWDAFGKRAGQDFVAAFATAKVPTQFIFIQDVLHQMEMLKPRARASAAVVAVQFAEGMVEKGQMTKGAFRGLIASLESQIPGLEQKLRKAGLTSSGEFTRALNFTGAKTKLADILAKYRETMQDTAISTKITGANVVENMNIAMRDLQAAMHSGPRAGRLAAKREFELMRKQAGPILDEIVNNTADAARRMRNSFRRGTKSARDAVYSNFSSMAGIITSAMNSGLISTRDGISKIGAALNKVLGALNQPQLKGMQLTVGAATVAAGAIVNTGLGNLGLATGGRVPGAVGPDNWTLVDQHGRPRAKVGGAELLIANRHTEAAASFATNMVYGKTLGQMVAGETRPHAAPGYATGGTVITGPVSTFGPPGEAAHSTAAGKSSADPGISLRIAGTHWNDPRNRALMGHTFRVNIAGHTGTLPDIDLGPNEWTGKDIDVTGAGAQVMGFNPLSFPTGTVGTAVEIGGGAISGSGAGLQQITAPKVHGGGAVGRIVQGAMNKLTKGANKYIAKHTPAPTAAGGGGMPPGTVMAHGGKAGDVATAMIAAANQILGLPYIYGGGHGSFSAPGYDCSGAVSYVLHAAGLLGSPESTDGLKTYGEPGGGKYITIGVRGSSGPNAHTMMSFFGKFFESGGSGGGPHWDGSWDGYFPISRHPKGFAKGGRVGNFGDVDPGVLLHGAPFLANDPDFQKYAKKRKGKNHVAWAGAFAQGGAFTANGPTVGLFGENGPETVVALPHAQLGGAFHADKKKKKHHPPSYLYKLPPKDRIGGVGTDDLDAAVAAAKTALDAFNAKLKRQTHKVKVPTTHTSTRHSHSISSKGKPTNTSSTTVTHGTTTKTVPLPPTDAQKHDRKRLENKLHNLKRLDSSAKEKIKDFTDLETQITNVGNYLTAAAGNPLDTAEGFDPKTGKITTKNWAGWHADIVQLDKKHEHKLRDAAKDVTRIVGKDRGATALGYVRAIQGAWGQAVIDLQSAEGDTDPNAPTTTFGTAASPDDYLALLPKSYSDKLQALNYAYALAQTNNVPDDPGTPQREDLASTYDDLLASIGLKDFYGDLLHGAQSDSRTRGNYPLLTSLADAFTGAQGTYQGLQDSYTQASAAGGPSQQQTFASAAEALLNQYASNVSPTRVDANGPGGLFASGTQGGAAPQKNVTIHQTFPARPDPHSWAQGVSWELEHAL